LNFGCSYQTNSSLLTSAVKSYFSIIKEKLLYVLNIPWSSACCVCLWTN
jgi:hypothetical protein